MSNNEEYVECAVKKAIKEKIVKNINATYKILKTLSDVMDREEGAYKIEKKINKKMISIEIWEIMVTRKVLSHLNEFFEHGILPPISNIIEE